MAVETAIKVKTWMSNCTLSFYLDLIINQFPNLNAGLANISLLIKVLCD